MEKDLKAVVTEISQDLAAGWNVIALSAGVGAGILTLLHADTPVTVEKISEELGFDADKVASWCSFAERFGIVARKDEGFVLTAKGLVVSPHSPAKEMLGFVNLTDYFMSAAVAAKEAFKKNLSLDGLSQGKITRDYQPKVSDNLSAVIVDSFKENDVRPGDTLLDLGSGAGSFVRLLAKRMPGVKFTGVDSNLFAIETARKENRNLGLTDQIKMLVADMQTDMGDFADGSYDWVTAINIFHFVAKDSRADLVDHFIRIARKGVFFNEGLMEGIPLMSPADLLLRLLYSDFSGWFADEEVKAFARDMQKRHPNCTFTRSTVVSGTANLVVVRKP
jgi:ubiquinone/menaquinone biosynthesis C-methylase UbiE